MTNTFDRLKTALADRYKIERHLGEGGMATVYVAEELRDAFSVRTTQIPETRTCSR